MDKVSLKTKEAFYSEVGEKVNRLVQNVEEIIDRLEENQQIARETENSIGVSTNPKDVKKDLPDEYKYPISRLHQLNRPPADENVIKIQYVDGRGRGRGRRHVLWSRPARRTRAVSSPQS